MKFYFFPLLICLVGCQKYYLTVQKQSLDVPPASVFARTPDPLKKERIVGEELIVEWRLTEENMEKPLILVVRMLMKNYEERVQCFPIRRKRGVVQVPLSGKDYEKTKGFLTYKATIETDQGEVLKEWKQQLFVELIRIE